MNDNKLYTHREYELHTKAKVSELQVSNKFKAAIRKLVMQAFEDGIRLGQGRSIEK